MTFYLCPRRPRSWGSLPGDRSQRAGCESSASTRRDTTDDGIMWMTNRRQVLLVSVRQKHIGNAAVHILINERLWGGHIRRTKQSCSSFSHPPVGCLGASAWLEVAASLTCRAISPVLFKTGMSAGYRKWLSHRLRLTWSSTAIQQCDNQISANKSWFAAQLKSGSSCFWKGLFDNVIELYQQEIVHGNVNNHKSNYFLISDPPPADAGSFRMGRKKDGDLMLPSPSSTTHPSLCPQGQVTSQPPGLISWVKCQYSRQRVRNADERATTASRVWCLVYKKALRLIWFRSWAGCINISVIMLTQPKSSFQTQTQQPESKR